MNVRLALDGLEIHATRDPSGEVTLTGNDGHAHRVHVLHTPDGGYAVETPAGLRPAEAAREGDTVWVHLDGRTYRFEIQRARRRRGSAPQGDLTAPMPGQIQRVLVSEGDAVEAGQPLLVLEAMKMQLEIKAPHSGRVQRLLAHEGQKVEAGAALVELEEAR